MVIKFVLPEIDIIKCFLWFMVIVRLYTEVFLWFMVIVVISGCALISMVIGGYMWLCMVIVVISDNHDNHENHENQLLQHLKILLPPILSQLTMQYNHENHKKQTTI